MMNKSFALFALLFAACSGGSSDGPQGPPEPFRWAHTEWELSEVLGAPPADGGYWAPDRWIIGRLAPGTVNCEDVPVPENFVDIGRVAWIEGWIAERFLSRQGHTDWFGESFAALGTDCFRSSYTAAVWRDWRAPVTDPLLREMRVDLDAKFTDNALLAPDRLRLRIEFEGVSPVSGEWEAGEYEIVYARWKPRSGGS